MYLTGIDTAIKVLSQPRGGDRLGTASHNYSLVPFLCELLEIQGGVGGISAQLRGKKLGSSGINGTVIFCTYHSMVWWGTRLFEVLFLPVDLEIPGLSPSLPSLSLTPS